MEIDTITYNGKEYGIIEEINNYVYFANLNNPKDLMIRKRENDLFITLNENELEEALLLIKEKNQ